MKRIWNAAFLFSAMTLAACGMSSADSAFESGSPSGGDAKNSGSAAPGGGSYGGASSSSGGSAAPGDGETPGTSTSTPGSQTPDKSALTAGVWDDNLNYDFFKKYLDLTTPSLTGLVPFTPAERDAAHTKWGQRAGAPELDVTFLLDTTGSMGDELSYIQNEIDGIAQSIKTKFPQTTPRFGLVLYKDQGDSYVTRWFDFKGLEEFRTNLASQTVGGGGDYPEAVAEGLTKTMALSWRSGSVARMAFWVADAPHHIGEEQTVRTAIDAAVQKDVHIYPVAASGADPRTEMTMRSAAQITGGRYVFLTDDSGIGNSHAEPHIPCYHVTKFNGALVRMVESEMTGTHVNPPAAEIIRSVGNPTNGVCATQSSGPVTIY